MINIKKEFIIFLVLFLVSSGLVHITAWLNNPIEQFQLLFSHPMPYHPFLYVFLIYIVIAIIRIVINLVKKLFTRK